MFCHYIYYFYCAVVDEALEKRRVKVVWIRNTDGARSLLLIIRTVFD